MPFVLLTRVTCTTAHATQQIANPVVRTSHITTLEFAIHDRKKVKKFFARKKFFVFAYSCPRFTPEKIRIRLLKIFRIRL